MSAREDIRVPFGLAVAMAGQPVSVVDERLDEYETAHRAEVLAEALDALLPLITSAGTTGQRVGVSRAMDELRRMATADPSKEQHDA